MAKIGGEFQAPGKHDRTRWQARVSFLRCIEDLAPHVLNDLRTTVQPAFREADATTTAESTSEGSLADDQQLAQQLRGEMRTEKAFDVHRLVSKSPRVEQARLELREAEECIAPHIQPLRREVVEAEKKEDQNEIAQLRKRIHRIWEEEISPLEKECDRAWEEEARRAAKGLDPDDEYHLPDDVLAGFARHRDRTSSPDWFFWEFEPTGDGSAPSPWNVLSPNTHVTVVRFHKALLDWAKKYYIAKPWLLDVAFWTLKYWIAGRELEGFTLPDFFQLEPPRFTFTHPGWNPTSSIWPTYEREVRQAFTDALCEYRDAHRKAARDQGLQPGLEKRELDRHLEWLVLWQIGDSQMGHWTYRRIAEKYGVGKTKQVGTPIRTKNTGITTVRDGLKSAANLIGITLYKGKPGKRGKPSS